MYSRGSNHDAQPTYKKALLKVFQAPDSPRQRAFKEDPAVFSYSREKSAKNINGAFQEFLGNADPSLFFEKITCMIFLTFQLQPHKMFKLAQTICRLSSTNCQSVFVNFVGLALKRLNLWQSNIYQKIKKRHKPIMRYESLLRRFREYVDN